ARIVGVETVERGRILSVEAGLATVAIGAGVIQIHGIPPEERTAEVHVCIRAEDVILLRGPAGPSSVRNRLSARVVQITPEGPLVRVALDCGFPLMALVTRPACEELDLRAGEPITALVKATAVHLIARGPGQGEP